MADDMSRITHLLNRTPSLRRNVRTPDGQGGFTETPTEVATPPGRRHGARGADRLVAGREDAEATHIWYFDDGTDVRVRDIIRDGGIDYEVVAIMPPSLDDHLKIQTKEIQTGAS